MLGNGIGQGAGVVDINIFETSSTAPGQDIGTVVSLNDGRKFRLCKNGAVALVPGKLVQAYTPTTVANWEDMAIGTHAVGDTVITITAGATDAVTKDVLADGYLVVGAGSGELGHCYKIKSNTAAAAAADFTVTLADAGGLRDAISASSTANLYPNLYNGVVIAAGTNAVVGVPITDVAANYYFWAQISGPCAVVSGGAITNGIPVLDNEDGTVIVDNAATAKTPVGQSFLAFDSGDAGLINLNIV